MIAEPDADTVLDLYAAYVADVNTRAGALLLALAAAAPADARLAEVWRVSQQQRLAGCTAMVKDIASKAELTVQHEEARDIVWALNSPDLHKLLVGERKWSTRHYATWLTATLRNALL